MELAKLVYPRRRLWPIKFLSRLLTNLFSVAAMQIELNYFPLIGRLAMASLSKMVRSPAFYWVPNRV